MLAEATALLSLLFGSAWAGEVRDFYGPAVDDYRAVAKDFQMIEQAIAGTLKIAPRLFPDGVGGVDVVMQDIRDFFIYSRNRSYPYPKVKR